MSKLCNSVILASILALSLCMNLAACGNAAASGGETTLSGAAAADTTVETTQNNGRDDLPELDYGGAEFRMMTFDQATLSWARAVLDVSEQTADTIDDAVYKRNRAVEDRLNVKILQLTRPYGDNDLAKMRQWIMSGDDQFEMGMEFVGNSRTLAMEGLLYSYDDLEYVDLGKDYWCQDLNNCTSIANKHFLVYGDYSLSTHDNTSVLVFNKQLYDDLNFGDCIYDVVKSGDWTYDTMNTKMTAAVKDVNGDSKMDESDQYGYEAAYKEVLPSFWIAGGETTINKDKDDIPYFALEGDTRFSEVFDKVFDLMYSDDHWFNEGNETSASGQLELFTDNQALFAHSTLYWIESLRDMNIDFGILPYPKYDSKQDNYFSRVGGGQFGVIPLTNSRLEMTGAVLEAMCAESRATVIPAYYDVMLASKLTRDNESSEMLDIIFANRVYDLGDTFWVVLIRDGVFRGMLNDNNRDLASTIDSIKNNVNDSINETVEGFTK